MGGSLRDKGNGEGRSDLIWGKEKYRFARLEMPNLTHDWTGQLLIPPLPQPTHMYPRESNRRARSQAVGVGEKEATCGHWVRDA